MITLDEFLDDIQSTSLICSTDFEIFFEDGSYLEYSGTDPFEEIKLTRRQLKELVQAVRFSYDSSYANTAWKRLKDDIESEARNDLKMEHELEVDKLNKTIEDQEYEIDDMKQTILNLQNELFQLKG